MISIATSGCFRKFLRLTECAKYGSMPVTAGETAAGVSCLLAVFLRDLTLSPLYPLVSLWLLVPLACRFYFGPEIRSAHGRIPGKLCRGRYGPQAGRCVSLSGPGRCSIHTVRISQAFRYLTLTTLYRHSPRIDLDNPYCGPVLRLCWGSSARYPANS